MLLCPVQMDASAFQLRINLGMPWFAVFIVMCSSWPLVPDCLISQKTEAKQKRKENCTSSPTAPLPFTTGFTSVKARPAGSSNCSHWMPTRVLLVQSVRGLEPGMLWWRRRRRQRIGEPMKNSLTVQHARSKFHLYIKHELFPGSSLLLWNCKNTDVSSFPSDHCHCLCFQGGLQREEMYWHTGQALD